LILSGNTLYGTARNGGSSGKGTVFSLSLPPPPQLTLAQISWMRGDLHFFSRSA
jgi:uncharacterized repeat protein (TIGR03803 family)